MKIELDINDSDANKIRSYSNDGFKVNNNVIKTNIIISRHYLEENWLELGYEHFATQHLDHLIEMQPEIIILGTGEKLAYPDQQILAYVNQHNIGMEIMETGAACRCYNLLIDEGREVVGCLFLPQS